MKNLHNKKETLYYNTRFRRVKRCICKFVWCACVSDQCAIQIFVETWKIVYVVSLQSIQASVELSNDLYPVAYAFVTILISSIQSANIRSICVAFGHGINENIANVFYALCKLNKLTQQSHDRNIQRPRNFNRDLFICRIV